MKIKSLRLEWDSHGSIVLVPIHVNIALKSIPIIHAWRIIDVAIKPIVPNIRVSYVAAFIRLNKPWSVTSGQSTIILDFLAPCVIRCLQYVAVWRYIYAFTMATFHMHFHSCLFTFCKRQKIRSSMKTVLKYLIKLPTQYV